MTFGSIERLPLSSVLIASNFVPKTNGNIKGQAITTCVLINIGSGCVVDVMAPSIGSYL